MKEIELRPYGRGHFAQVDDEDYDYLVHWKWSYRPPGKHEKTGYAYRWEGQWPKDRKQIWMHRCILQTPESLEVDHLDHNGCNNQKYNMRNCTHLQNSQNLNKRKYNKSGYIGVSQKKYNQKWVAQITNGEKVLCLGYYEDPKEAAHAYDRMAQKLRGDFAVLNFPR